MCLVVLAKIIKIDKKVIVEFENGETKEISPSNFNLKIGDSVLISGNRIFSKITKNKPED